MSHKSLHFESSKCIGCRLCEIICSLSHYQVINPEMALIRIRRDHVKQIDNAIYCHQCIDAPCIESCEYEALLRELETNAIIVDEKNCIACMDCYYACPYSTPKLNLSNEHIVFCDLCGGEPACVAICPEHAIQYLENKSNSGEN